MSLCWEYFMLSVTNNTIMLNVVMLSVVALFLSQSPLDIHKKWLHNAALNVEPGNPYWRERISAVDILALISLDQLLFILKILFTYVTQQATLMWTSTVMSLPLQLVFPGRTIPAAQYCVWTYHCERKNALIKFGCRNMSLDEFSTLKGIVWESQTLLA